MCCYYFSCLITFSPIQFLPLHTPCGRLLPLVGQFWELTEIQILSYAGSTPPDQVGMIPLSLFVSSRPPGP